MASRGKMAARASPGRMVKLVKVSRANKARPGKTVKGRTVNADRMARRAELEMANTDKMDKMAIRATVGEPATERSTATWTLAARSMAPEVLRPPLRLLPVIP